MSKSFYECEQYSSKTDDFVKYQRISVTSKSLSNGWLSCLNSKTARHLWYSRLFMSGEFNMMRLGFELERVSKIVRQANDEDLDSQELVILLEN